MIGNITRLYLSISLPRMPNTWRKIVINICLYTTPLYTIQKTSIVDYFTFVFVIVYHFVNVNNPRNLGHVSPYWAGII